MNGAHTLVLPDRASWLEARRQGLGSSDAAALVGATSWSSPLQVYCEKLGIVEASAEENEFMYWGRELEPLIAKRYVGETKRVIEDPGPFTIQQHSSEDFLLATIDRLIVGGEEVDKQGPGVLELKTANFFLASDWAEEPPLAYQVQLQHQLMVTGLPWGSLAVLIGGQRFLYRDEVRNDGFIAKLRQVETEFWQRVVNHDPPPPDASNATRDLLARLYAEPTKAEPVLLPPEAEEWDRQRLAAIEMGKRAEALRTEAENKIKYAIGESLSGVVAGGLFYSWKIAPKKGYTVAPCAPRVLRRHTP